MGSHGAEGISAVPQTLVEFLTQTDTMSPALRCNRVSENACSDEESKEDGVSPRRHHVVSSGYLRHFSEGKLIRLWDKTDNTWTRPIGVRDCFVEKGFNSVYSSDPSGLEHMEDEWARIEGLVLPAIDAAESGDRSNDVAMAVKAIAAIHLCRSYAFFEIQSKITASQREEAADFESESRMIEAFVKDHGRQPRAGEIEQRVHEYIDRLEKSRAQFADGMARIYGQVVEILDPLHLQFAVPRTKTIGLMTGDTPVAIASGIGVGTRGGVGIATSELRYMPLSRWMAVSFGAEALADRELALSDVQRLNLLMWRSSKRFLAAHPSEDIPRALGRRAPDGWPPDDQVSS